MPDMPNKEIEKQLRDYASGRRDAAGTPELHPATRRLLHAEVRREFGGATRPQPGRRWQISWPRFALGSAVLATLAALFVVINQSEQGQPQDTFMLAKNEEKQLMAMPTAALESTVTPAPARKESGAEIAGTGRRELLADSAGERRNGAKAAAYASTEAEAARPDALAARGAMAASSTPAPARASVAGQDELKVREDSTIAAKAMTLNAKGAAASGSPALSGDLNLALNNSTTQRFLNTAAAAVTRDTRAPVVLAEFVVEQAGNSLKIVDRDGSVYRGNIQRATNTLNVAASGAPSSAPAVPTSPAATTIPGNSPTPYGGATEPDVAGQSATLTAQSAAQMQNQIEPVNYVFEVEGTNRSLRQRVVFNGNWTQNVTPFNVQNTSNLSQNFQIRTGPPAQNEAFKLNASDNFINGRVFLDNSRSGTELNALPVIEQQR